MVLMEGSTLKEKIKGTESIKVNFEFEGFEFELFAQPKCVIKMHIDI